MTQDPPINLTIKRPCPANWEGMTPDKNGRFCDECKLTVVDFTIMSDTEVKKYLEGRVGKKTCGRFNPSQLTNQNNSLLGDKLLTKIKLNFYPPYLKAMVLFGLTILTSLLGCRRPNYPPIVGDVTGEPEFIEQRDSTIIIPELHRMGKIRVK